MKTSESIAKITAAMVAVQSDESWAPIGKDKKASIPTKSGGKFEYGYADLSACYEQIVPLFAKHGIAIFQPTRTQGTDVTVTTLIAHGGEWISEEFTVPAAERGAQAIGSAATYAKRYALLGMCSIASTNEDDDGKAAHEAARREPSKQPLKPQSRTEVSTKLIRPVSPAEHAAIHAKDREPGADDVDPVRENNDVDLLEMLAHLAACETEADLAAQKPAITDLKNRLKAAGQQAGLDRLTKTCKERFEAITGKDAVTGAKGQPMPGWAT